MPLIHIFAAVVLALLLLDVFACERKARAALRENAWLRRRLAGGDPGKAARAEAAVHLRARAVEHASQGRPVSARDLLRDADEIERGPEPVLARSMRTGGAIDIAGGLVWVRHADGAWRAER